MNKSSHPQISQILNTILTKCSQNLYQKYLLQKLPNQCNQKTCTNIQASFQAMFEQKPIKSSINRQPMPMALKIDNNISGKICIKSRSQRCLSSHVVVSKHKIFDTQLEYNNNTSPINKKYATITLTNQNQTQNAPSQRTIQKITIPKQPISHKQIQNQEILRTYKKQSLKQKINQELQHTIELRKQQQKKYKYNALESKVKELLLEGVPFAYDDDGNFIMPDVKMYKKQKQMELKGRNIQGRKLDKKQKQHKTIIPKKRLLIDKFMQQRKRKISEQQFTNKNQRQNSSIPFMNVADGVKIVQKQRNIMAQKLKQQQITRQQFLKTSQKSFFRSFMPDSNSQYSSFRISSAVRPNTQAKSRNSFGLASTVSLSTRPKTSKQFNRININNKQLAVELVRQNRDRGTSSVKFL